MVRTVPHVLAHLIDPGAGPTSPPSALSTLPNVTSIVQYLARLPRTSAHPAGSHIAVTMNQARESYLSVRREYILTKCITPVVRGFDEETTGPLPGGEEEARRGKCRKIATLLDGMLSMMQVR